MPETGAAPPDGGKQPARTIQSLWIGERLSRIEVLSIRSFQANGHSYHLYAYDPVDNVPDGVVIKDANSVIDRNLIFRVNGSLSIFADWFRQEMLHACGGYWADLDLVCLRPLTFDDEIVVGKVDASRVSNALMRFPAGHPITRQLADVSRSPNTIMEFDSPRDKRRKYVRRFLMGNRRHNVGWGEPSGPSGLTKMLKHHGMMKLAKPYFYFYPLHFSFWACAFDDTFSEGSALLDQSYCLHLWNEKIRRMTGVDKDGPFRRGSLVDQIMKRFGC